MNKKIKNDNAITIVSLVVTIIIILILAGISIATLSGPNGLIEKVKMASLNSKTEEIKEKIQLKLTNLTTEKMMEGKEKATLKDVLKMKNEDDEIIDAFEEDDSVILIIDKYECKVSKEMEVKSVSEYNPAQLRSLKRTLTYCSFDERNLIEE